METKFTKSLKRVIEYSFYLFVFLLPWQTKLILVPADTNFNEISLYVSHLLLLVTLITFFVYKLKRPEVGVKISWMWWSLAGLEISILVSFFVAPDQLLAFFYYLLFLMAVGVFYIVREGTKIVDFENKFFHRSKIIYIFLLSIFFQATLGVYQFLTQTSPVSKYLGLAAHNPEALGTSVIETASGRWLRVYGGMDHPNIFGGVLAITLILAAYLLAKKKIIRGWREISESIFLFLFYFVALLALFFTFSRTAWIAYAFGLLALLISFLLKRDRWIIGRYLALIYFSGVMIFIIGYPYQSLLQVRIKADTRLEQISIDERSEYVMQSKEVIMDNSLIGVGVGNYPQYLRDTDANKKEGWNYQPVHNVFLLLWSECGVFALIFFLSFLASTYSKNHRAAFSGAILVALIIIMIFDHWLISLPFGIIFLFLALGLI